MLDSFLNYSSLLLVAFPAFGAFFLMLIPNSNVRLTHSIAQSISFTTMIVAILSFVFFDPENSNYQFRQTFEWLNIISINKIISLDLGVDGISSFMVMLTGIVMFTGVLSSSSITNRVKDFFILYFVLISGVFGVFVSIDLFFLFFFYELAVVPMYLLISVWGSSSVFKTFSRTKDYGALKLTLFLVAGSVLIWVGLLSIFVESNATYFNLIDIKNNGGLSPKFQTFIFPFILVGFGVLGGLWPFHTWSPDGHVAAPTSVSMVHAGVLMKLGAYGFLKIGILLLPEGAQEWMPILLILGTINVLYGAISAMGQHDLKYVIGYSSVSHMGYVFMGIGTLHHLGVTGSVMQMFSHGIMTALFFSTLGVIYEKTGSRDINVLEGLAKKMPLITVFFVIAGFASLGLPSLSGFVSELLVFLGLFKTHPVFGALGVIGAAITAIYILRLIAKVFFGPAHNNQNLLTSVTIKDKISSVILVFFVIAIGSVPFPFIAKIENSVHNLLLLGLGS
ncbi:MAG: NADH-quinone oxidoreductase subunit M [SAR202 cluster bacterium]|nr:NADH-quinone oxidoreductase subunit M [SAR202 cluster bacterium]|tara:strand:- start:26593 stop:28110 length:1518 start_codon:yes stop_codon:yes gene_type:complete